MATLVLSAVGSYLGGPLGGSIGSIAGSIVDAKLFGPPDNEGPRLEELKVTTSSYGTPVPRHFGRMRAAGTIVWATDLVESSEKTSNGKGKPSTVTYTYSSSFAVALASRPIASVGRIWADGTLLRGAAGDMKVAGTLRVHSGGGDQKPDPLIASAEGSSAPAFRGLAYCVFEDLQLADFGNRIPALTFEIVADNGDVSLAEMLAPAGNGLDVARPLDRLEGYSDEGRSLADMLGSIDRVYPVASDAGADSLSIFAGDASGEPVTMLPPPVSARDGDAFGGASGKSANSGADPARIPSGLRYYDVDRDFQAGLQRASGRATPGRNRILEFPGALRAGDAKTLADGAAERAAWSQERLSYRVAELDPALTPGKIVAVPGRAGRWRLEAWEWRDTGLELELLRLPHRSPASGITEGGRSLVLPDRVATPTILAAFELPWDGTGSAFTRKVYAAASSVSDGWTGAALYVEDNGALASAGATGRQRSVTGVLAATLLPRSPHLVDRHSALHVTLASEDFVLDSATMADLAQGANRALVGEEVVQFADAEHLGGADWLLTGLLRGRGGTEHHALAGTDAGAAFTLLDNRTTEVDEVTLGSGENLAAIGLADDEPVVAPIAGAGSSLRPLAPVHGRFSQDSNGSVTLCWTRRARGAWQWSGTVEIPLNEQAENYEVGLGDPARPDMTWSVSEPRLQLTATQFAQLQADHSGADIWVRQVGTFSRSIALHLITID